MSDHACLILDEPLFGGIEQEGPRKGLRTLFIAGDKITFSQVEPLLGEFDQVYLGSGRLTPVSMDLLDELASVPSLRISVETSSKEVANKLMTKVHELADAYPSEADKVLVVFTTEMKRPDGTDAIDLPVLDRVDESIYNWYAFDHPASVSMKVDDGTKVVITHQGRTYVNDFTAGYADDFPIKLPTKKHRIYQIESSSSCSATCSFCPQPTMQRTKENISWDNFKATIDLMENKYVALHHFGEPLLHPQLPEMIEYANSQGKVVEFSTNGKGLHNDKVHGDEYLRRVLRAKPHRIRVAYDFFRPEAFIRDLLTFNVCTIVTTHAVTEGVLKERKAFNNWAGQLEGDERPSEISGECYYLKYQYKVAMANGLIVPCCQDFEGKHVLGSVNDPDSIKDHPSEGYDLCKSCSGMQFAATGTGQGWWEELGLNQALESGNVANKAGELKDNVPREKPKARRRIPIIAAKD